MSKLSWWKPAYAVFLLCVGTAMALPAQTFTTLHSFESTDGSYPQAALVQSTDGDLYGTTGSGGATDCPLDPNGCGTIFKITPTGTLTSLYGFCSQSGCSDGTAPYAGLVQATDGNFYGTTYGGGATGLCDYGQGCGTVFKITPTGTLTTLHTFDSTDGGEPAAALIQGNDGNFYGTTYEGGANQTCVDSIGCGTVFKITPGGTLTTLHSFDFTDGAYPMAGLVQANDGNFYGTTYGGGANTGSCFGEGCGTVFEITPSGTLATLYSFCSQSGCTDGYFPDAGLVQGTDGDFYGTTYEGGANGYGTVFKITPGGALTTLYSFCSQRDCKDGEFPQTALVRAVDGNFYGTTIFGGPNNGGTVFKITPTATLTTLYSFCSQGGCSDGNLPLAALAQDTNGSLFGTTLLGGSATCSGGCGTIFGLSIGSAQFVETHPAFGKVGAAIKILGTDLSGATSVTFNGTPAVFEVVSASLITTTVPEGATSGKVQVTVPGNRAPLSSNVLFRVAP